jgi:hypothetical protein
MSTNAVPLTDEDVETVQALIEDALVRTGPTEALTSLAEAIDMKVRTVPPEEHTPPEGKPIETVTEDTAGDGSS